MILLITVISLKRKRHIYQPTSKWPHVLGIYANYARKKIPDYIKLHSATQINVLLYTDAPLISSQSVSIVESRSSLPSRERHCWDLAGENQIVNLSIGRLNIKALNSIKQETWESRMH